MTLVEIPCISLSHLHPGTLRLLQHEYHQPFLYAVHDNGVFLQVASEHHWPGIELDLVAIFARLRHAAPFGWIMLDVDGDVLPGLPTYEDT